MRPNLSAISKALLNLSCGNLKQRRSKDRDMGRNPRCVSTCWGRRRATERPIRGRASKAQRLGVRSPVDRRPALSFVHQRRRRVLSVHTLCLAVCISLSLLVSVSPLPSAPNDRPRATCKRCKFASSSRGLRGDKHPDQSKAQGKNESRS